MFKKFLSLPDHTIRVRVKGKRKIKRKIICGVRYGPEITAEYIFYGNEKAIEWAKRTLDGVDENMKKKKVLRCFKDTHREKAP